MIGRLVRGFSRPTSEHAKSLFFPSVMVVCRILDFCDGYLAWVPVAWSLKVMAYRLYRWRSFWLRSKACTPSPLLAGQPSQRPP
jgi:hypothetical protein